MIIIFKYEILGGGVGESEAIIKTTNTWRFLPNTTRHHSAG